MSTPHGPYTSEPAAPILAHSLLHQSLGSSPELHYDSNQSSTWNLKHDVNQGFQDSPNSLFRYGTVIGFSRLRNNADDDDTNIEDVAELPRTLIASHLSQTARKYPSPQSPRVYIIHPANYDGFSPNGLLASLLSTGRQEHLSRDEAISRLDAVQLLPVFDLPAAVHAIDEVSYELQRLSKPASTDKPPVLFIVAGLDVLTDGIVRASNTTRGTAILATVLRTLTQLSRQHGSYLSVMLVGTGGVGSLPLSMSASGRMRADESGDRVSNGDGVYSVFSGGSDAPLFPGLLMRTMDYGIDCHLLLSTVKGTQVVEVIKDRVGGNLGRWAVWRAGK